MHGNMAATPNGVLHCEDISKRWRDSPAVALIDFQERLPTIILLWQSGAALINLSSLTCRCPC
jgi:hypothetical protein